MTSARIKRSFWFLLLIFAMAYVNPVPGGILGRTDQGVDVSATPGTPIYAIANEQVVGIIPNWYQGQPFVWFRQLGTNIYNYVAEQINNLPAIGTKFKAGQQVATVAPSGTGLELGFATASGQTLARATTGYTEGQATQAGTAYRARVFSSAGVGTNTGGGGTPGGVSNNLASIVQQAAANYRMPSDILMGVWGIESTFGSNVKTSSAGAMGDFQFIPTTAQTYNYPMTNNPTTQQFRQQADAAAHYLSDLFSQQGGSWDAALMKYSGGGYGLSAVLSESSNAPTYGGTRPGGDNSNPDITTVLANWYNEPAPNTQEASTVSFLGIPWLPNPLDLFKAIGSGISDTVDFLKILGWMLNPVNILRMVEFLIGIAMMAFGLQAAMQMRGERLEGYETSESALSRSGLGRVSREVANAVSSSVPETRVARARRRVAPAPHRTRRTALRVRYEREQNVSRRLVAQRRATGRTTGVRETTSAPRGS